MEHRRTDADERRRQQQERIVHATDRSKSPVSVKLIPATSAYGAGHRSVRNPTTGWSSDAVSINASVIRPICEKLSANDALSNG